MSRRGIIAGPLPAFPRPPWESWLIRLLAFQVKNTHARQHQDFILALPKLAEAEQPEMPGFLGNPTLEGRHE